MAGATLTGEIHTHFRQEQTFDILSAPAAGRHSG